MCRLKHMCVLHQGAASTVSLATFFDFWKKKNTINSFPTEKFFMLCCRLLIFFKSTTPLASLVDRRMDGH